MSEEAGIGIHRPVTLSETMQAFLAELVYELIPDGDSPTPEREQIEQALRDGADRLLLAIPKLLHDFQPSFERSLNSSPGDRRAEWRTEMHEVMLASANGAAGFATLADELAKRGMGKADAEHELLLLELVAVRDHAERMQDLAMSENKWFTEGADFTPAPGNTTPTIAQVWGELIRMDPDDRLVELQMLMSDGEGRVLR